MASKKSNKKPSAPVKKSAAKKIKPAAKAAAPKASTGKKPVKAAVSARTAKSPVLAKTRKTPASIKATKPVVTAKTAGKAVARNVLVAAPVKTGKSGRNEAGLTVKELAGYREMLLAKRRELLGDVSSMEDEALRSSGQSNLSNLPIHMADMGTDNYEQEFTLGLVEKDRNLLRDINSALAKIVNGSYGICEGTGKPISKARLDAQPWARFSIEHARTMEQRRMRA